MCVGDYGIGFVDFNKWKHDNICEVLHSIYSKTCNNRIKIIINYLMNSLNLSNISKAICVIDK